MMAWALVGFGFEIALVYKWLILRGASCISGGHIEILDVGHGHLHTAVCRIEGVRRPPFIARELDFIG